MNKLINFFIQIGKLKERKRRGWVAHDIKNPEVTASHIFRTAFMAWILAEKRGDLDIEKVIKMALIHDICEVHTEDETPYDPLLPKDLKDKKKVNEVLDKWPSFTLVQKKKKAERKYKRELESLEKVIKDLPEDLQREIMFLWKEFEQGKSKEGRFMKQIDKAESYLQGMEYWKRYGKIRQKLWARWAKEIFDDPVVVDFYKEIDEKFTKK